MRFRGDSTARYTVRWTQIVGAVNYYTPVDSFETRTGGSYCPAALPASCTEDNVGGPGGRFTLRTPVPPGSRNVVALSYGDLVSGPNATDRTKFTANLARVNSLLIDAFDGFTLGNSVSNGRVWNMTSNPITLAPSAGGHGNDEIVQLDSEAFFRLFVHLFERDNHLREPTFLMALNDLMASQRINWCARCELFRLHHPGETCDPAGPRPAGLQCVWEGCPAGSTPEPRDRSCHPPCPSGMVFDAHAVSCVPVNPVP